MQDKIDNLKLESRINLEKYSKEAREYIQEYGNDNSDYLTSKRETISYYRGKYNAMIELEKM